MHGGELLSIDHDDRVRPKGPQSQWLGHQHNIFYIHGNQSRLPEFKIHKIAVHVKQEELDPYGKHRGKLSLQRAIA